MSTRSRTRERQREREKQKRRQQQITLLVGIVAVAVIVVVLIIVSNQPAEAPIPEGAAARYEGIPQSESDAGYPVLGNLQAPVRLVEYSSFACSGCASFHDQIFGGLLDRIRNNEISFTFVPISNTGSIQNGPGATRAAICAAEQGKFWEMHDALFLWHTSFGQQAFTQNRLQAGVGALGLDGNAFNQCFNGDSTSQLIDAALQEASRIEGFAGTPTLLVNGVIADVSSLSTVNQAIDAALALTSGVPIEATAEATTESTPEAAQTTPEATSQAEATPEATEAG